MMYFKATDDRYHKGSLVRYVEVADDQYANRQVLVFSNGVILRYDRRHWCDHFGMLLGLKFSRKPKWRVFFPGAGTITEGDFEKVWKDAQASPYWKDQRAKSLMWKWGDTPHGLPNATNTQSRTTQSQK